MIVELYCLHQTTGGTRVMVIEASSDFPNEALNLALTLS